MWICFAASADVVAFAMRISPMRAAMFITAATSAGSARLMGARTDGGGDVRASSIVATRCREPEILSHNELPSATRSHYPLASYVAGAGRV